MITYIRPALGSQWIDTELDVTYTVDGINGMSVLVTCRHKNVEWLDAMPVELFGTELSLIP